MVSRLQFYLFYHKNACSMYSLGMSQIIFGEIYVKKSPFLVGKILYKGPSNLLAVETIYLVLACCILGNIVPYIVICRFSKIKLTFFQNNLSRIPL